MKIIALVLALATAALAAALGAMVAHPYYAHRLAEIAGSDHLGYRAQVHAETARIINAGRFEQGGADPAFFGASTIERLDVRRFGPVALNFGLGGASARDLLAYWREQPQLARLGRSVILVGFNDLAAGREPAAIARDVEALLALRERGSRVLLVGVLPVNPRTLSAEVANEDIAALNLLLAKVCAASANCRFVDPIDGSSGFAMPLPARFDAGDGVHLNAAGNARLADLIEDRLDG